MGGLRRIILHTALRPWVTLSAFNECDSFSTVSPFPGEHMFSKTFKTDFGKYGDSQSNLLKDLSEGGKESLSASACIRSEPKAQLLPCKWTNKKQNNKKRVQTTASKNVSYTEAAVVEEKKSVSSSASPNNL